MHLCWASTRTNQSGQCQSRRLPRAGLEQGWVRVIGFLMSTGEGHTGLWFGKLFCSLFGKIKTEKDAHERLVHSIGAVSTNFEHQPIG